MPVSKTVFKPGVVKDDSALAAEGTFIDSDKMRGRRGQMETIGGCQLFSIETMLESDGITPSCPRGAHAWSDLNGNPLVACGSASKLYAFPGNAKVDITPPLGEGVLGAPFSTTNGSAVVAVKHPLHGLATGNTITFSNASQIANLTLNGTFAVSVLNQSSYTITAPANANATVTSGSTATVDYVAPLPAGNVDGLGIGYGSGPYGAGPYGATTVTDTAPRIWSLANFGENLLAVPRDGALYEWQPAFRVAELILNGGFDTDTQWAKTGAWAISGGVATKSGASPATLSQNIVNAVAGGKVYRVTFTATAVTNPGNLRLQVNAGSPTPALIDVNGSSGYGASTPITQAGTYTRTFRMPANAVDIAFVADGPFAGSIDNVSLKLESRAYRIDEAPRNIGYMFVTPERFVVALATQQADGVYNPALVRWSAQENNRIWVPDTDNLAGEFPLSIGGTALSGLAARQQNIVWTSSGLYTMTFTGDDSAFSFKAIGTGAGIIGRNAAVEQGGIAFWVSRAGFYIFQGAIAQKIDCPIERDFFDNLTPLQEEKIYAGVNSAFSEIWFCYPDSRDGTNECSRVAVFNFIEQHWVTHTFDRTAWVAAGIFPRPLGFSSRGTIFEHESGNDLNGNPLNAYATLAPFDAEDGDHHIILKRILPDFDDQVGSVAFEVTPMLSQRGQALPTTTRVASPTTKELFMRCKGRQQNITIRGIGAPSFFRFGAIRMDVDKGAARR